MIKTEKAHLQIAANSHPGMTGKQNEDRYRVTAFKGGRRANMPSVLAVLCDGIGGHRAGEVAAEMGVSIITDVVAHSEGRRPLETLTEAISQAGAAVYQASQADSGRSGMGATCACAWVIGNRLYTANLGDSRIYLLRGGHFIQLTTDHTWIQEALDAGIITGEEGNNHPNAHVIRRYLGSKGAPEPDLRLWVFDGEDDEAARANQGLRLRPEDLLLICSDGLTDLVSDDEIRGVLAAQDLDAAPDVLIRMANERGGHDNTTVVLLKVPPKGGSRGGKRRWLIGCVTLLALFSVVIALALAGLRLGWWRSFPLERPIATEAVTEAPPGGVPEGTLEERPGEGEPQAVTPTAGLATLTPAETLAEDEPLEPGAAGPSITPWPTNTPAP
jgi:protein phosphatase